ncbi:hypothetical protein D3C80_1191090 [compost metagenome]
MPGIERQLWQCNLLQVALERTAQAERTRRPVEVALEFALIVAIAVLHLAIEAAQRDLRRWLQRIQTQPGKVQPIDGRLGAQACLPVGTGREFEALIRAGSKVQGAQLRTLGIDPALQAQGYRLLLGRQTGRAEQLIAALQVAVGAELQIIQLQRVRQLGTGFERLGTDL